MTELAPLPTGPVRRVAFLGTPAMAVPVLSALVDAGFDVGRVVTRADKRRGRGSDLLPSPVKSLAVELGVEIVHRPEDLLDDGCGSFDLGVVVAYGALIKRPVLERIPMVNLHFSLLPRWRGAAPVERALLAGDTETGVCLMQVDEGLDTGGVLDRRSMPITDTTTADDIRRSLVAVGIDMLIGHLRRGLPPARPQTGESCYAAKIEASELAIDWSDGVGASRLVRLGGAHTNFRGRRLKIHEIRFVPGEPVGAPGQLLVERSRVHVATSDGLVELLVVQPEGKARMDAASWINGIRPSPGEGFSLG